MFFPLLLIHIILLNRYLYQPHLSISISVFTQKKMCLLVTCVWGHNWVLYCQKIQSINFSNQTKKKLLKVLLSWLAYWPIQLLVIILHKSFTPGTMQNQSLVRALANWRNKTIYQATYTLYWMWCSSCVNILIVCMYVETKPSLGVIIHLPSMKQIVFTVSKWYH